MADNEKRKYPLYSATHEAASTQKLQRSYEHAGPLERQRIAFELEYRRQNGTRLAIPPPPDNKAVDV